jgi:hypothetical protein
MYNALKGCELMCWCVCQVFDLVLACPQSMFPALMLDIPAVTAVTAT